MIMSMQIGRLAEIPERGPDRAELRSVLTPRELEVLALIAHGPSNRQISQKFVVS